MPRLNTLKTGMAVLGISPTLPVELNRDQIRSVFEPWRAWYALKDWKVLRDRVLLRDRYTCQRCRHCTGLTQELIAHHKTVHKGDARLFWNELNLITVCKDCHDGPIKALERNGLSWPADDPAYRQDPHP